MVVSRRNFLRGWTLAAMTPSLATGQIYTATSISQAAQQARREVGRLGRRADGLLRQTAADGTERAAAAVRRFRAEQVSLSRDLAAIFNGRVAEDDFLLIVPTRELDLALAMQPLVIRIAPRPEEVEASLKEPLPKIEPLKEDEVEDVVLMVVLANLGAKADDHAMFAQLKDDSVLSAALRDTTASVRAKNYGLAALDLERLMRVASLPRNIEVIAAGKPDRIRSIYRVLVVKFVPFIGWTLFTAQLLASIYQSRDSTAPMLR
jgi:hypothetical protein